MIRSTLFVVSMTLASAGCGADNRTVTDAPRPENSQSAVDLPGKWLVTEIVYHGQPLPVGEVRPKNSIWNFSDTTIENTRANGPPSKGNWTRDATTYPKRLQIMVDGSTMRCIYSIEHNTLKLCIAGSGSHDYPTKFESTANPPTELLTLQRQ